MKYSGFWVSFLLFVLVACKKEQDTTPSPDDIVRIKELNYSVYQNYSSAFIYSQDGRVARRITKAWFDDPDNYSSDTTAFEYTGNNVSSIKFAPTSFTNLGYDSDGNITRSEFFHNGALIRSENYLYDKRILREIQDEKQNVAITFTYDSNGNLSVKTYYFKREISKIERFLEHDDKPNPFKGHQLVFDNSGFNLDRIDYFSNNNPLKSEVEWIANRSHRDTLSHNYIYNGEGFWTKGRQYLIKYN